MFLLAWVEGLGRGKGGAPGSGAVPLQKDLFFFAGHTVGTKIVADPEKRFQELISEKNSDFVAG